MIGQQLLQKYEYFFKDIDNEFEASQDVVLGIVRNLSPLVILKGDYLVRKGSHFDNFFFIQNGNIRIIDQKYNYLTSYIEGGFLGEFQIMLEIKSLFYYVGGGPQNTYLLKVGAKKF